jgi:alpha-beta hydrolase superfamily lysophospholipase
MIYHNESKFQGVGGLELYYQSWQPEGTARAILVIVHGLGSHSGRYKNIVEHLLPKQYAVYGLDWRGHGRSAGQKGYINAWTELRADLHTFLELIQQQQPGCPIFLMGHSLGGVIVLDYVLHHPEDASKLQGVITLAPSIGEVGISLIRVLLGKLLSKLWPRFTMSTGIDLAAGSRDEQMLKEYAEDQLRHTCGTARLATEFFATRRWIHTHAANWQVPLLILHGGADRVAVPAGSEAFYQQVTYPDKLRIEYPGAYHELHCDINYQEVLTDLENWLEKHLATETEKLESTPLGIHKI